MKGRVTNFMRGYFWVEIKGSGRAVAAANRVKFRIEIKNLVAGNIDNSQIGVSGTLQFSVDGSGKIALESRRRVEQFPQRIFEVTADLVDALDSDRTLCAIHPRERFIQREADLFKDALVCCVFRIERQHAFAGRVHDHLAERNSPKLRLFIEEPWNQLIDRR